jgi:serine phosphatase RsbU (regulator of sigma subunit)/PAS domain-containing protein/anti-sigma regulatory factor (Ser/Thr protein kinase)
VTVDRTYALPAADLLAVLDEDAQGWAIAQAVRAGDEIVDFALVYLNEAGAQILGRPPGELIGGRYRELWPETIDDGTLRLYTDVVRTRRPATRSVYYERSTISGHFEIRVMPCGDGFAARFVDLTKLTLRPGSTAGARLYEVLDAAFDGFMLLRAEAGEAGEVNDFVCEFVNQTGAKLSGMTVEDLIGHRARDFSPRGVQAGLLDRCIEVLRTGQAWRRELRSTDGGQSWEIKISRADPDHVAVSYRDVTERAQQQERVSRGEAQARQAAERTAALQAVTAALAAASTPAEVYEVIGSLVRPSAGGAGLVVLLVDEGRLTVNYNSGYEPEVVERLHGLPLRHSYPATEVVRTGRPRYVSGRADFDAAQAVEPAPVPAGDRHAWAFLPMASAGVVIGVLVIGYRDPRAFDEAERDALMAFSGLSAQALQRALLFEAQRSIAADLQRALLPADLPALRGARHAVRYLPWTHGAEVGGDWYDVIPLGPDAVAVVIGDVAGHSPNAAAIMGQIRNALRAYAADGHSPTGVMDRVNRLMMRVEPESVASCCYLEVHLAEGTATGVIAGHPPPVLYSGGRARPLPLRYGPPLGVEDRTGYVDTSFLLPGGSALVLYTDGLVEDKRYDIDRGVADLCAAVSASVRAAPSLDPETVVEGILAADVGPFPRSDDVAILALTIDGVVDSDPGLSGGLANARRRFGGDAASAPAARRFAADILSAWGESALVDNARLLLGEVITNAVQHTVGDVEVRLSLGPRRLRVEVRDRSDRQPDRREALADSESGRGLHIVEVLARDWGYEPIPTGGKVVWFELDRSTGTAT